MFQSSVGDFLHVSESADASSGAFLNDTLFPNNFDYMSPPVPVIIDSIRDTTSQRFHVGI